MEEIQTYQDGQLIKTQLAEISLKPDISLFITLMLNDVDYQLLSRNSNNQVARSRLELGIIRMENKPILDSTDWRFIIENWNYLINDCEKSIFNSFAISTWNNIVQSCNLPLTIDETLRMIYQE